MTDLRYPINKRPCDYTSLKDSLPLLCYLGCNRAIPAQLCWERWQERKEREAELRGKNEPGKGQKR